MTPRKKRAKPATEAATASEPATATEPAAPVESGYPPANRPGVPVLSITLYYLPENTRYAYLHLQEPNALSYVPIPCDPEPVVAATAAARFKEYEAQGMPAIEAYVRLGTEFRHIGSLGLASAT